MSLYIRAEREVKVGVVGPHELVERIMLSGLPQTPDAGTHVVPLDTELGLRRRLVMAPYVSEQEAADRVARLGDGADACLFASRIPLNYARRAGVLACPATCIQLGGTPLYAALLRARHDGIDPGQGSFDGLSRAELEAGLGDLGIPADGVHLRDEIATGTSIASFHERMWRLGQTSAAFTCMDQVARKLSAAGVPVVALRPTDRSIRSALQVATLLAAYGTLSDSQLTVALVEVPALRETARRPAPRQAREELQLTVHRFLVREAQRIQATVSKVGEHAFLVLATSGSLQAAGDPPFTARARATLGLILDVGVGTGRSEHEAEAQARLALGQAAQAQPEGPRPARAQGRLGIHPAAPAVAGTARRAMADSAAPGSARPGRAGPGGADPGGAGPGPPDGAVSGGAVTARAGAVRAGGREVTGPGQQPRDDRTAGRRPPTDSFSRLRALETLSRLSQKLAADSAPVVDAELTGQLLSVTPRTARRQLRALVDEGLALPLPPARRQHPGRPRQAYRLVVEKLERRAAQ
jgi:hypothetical protein